MPVPERSRALRRAITTVSDPAGRSSRAWRNHSRIQRFTRFRITALPTRLLTVTPSLLRPTFESIRVSVGPSAGEPAPAEITTTKLSELRRSPDLTALAKSRVRSNRSARRKRPVLENTGLLRGYASCEALTALGTTSLENRTSSASLETRPKSMNPLSANTARLIGTFHRRPFVSLRSFEGGRGLRVDSRRVSSIPSGTLLDRLSGYPVIRLSSGYPESPSWSDLCESSYP